MKNTDKKTKIRQQKKPLGTKKNPWFSTSVGNKKAFFRITPYGVWMTDKLPKKAIVNE